MEGRPPKGLNKAATRETVMVTMSDTMKEALDAYAGKQNETRSHIVRAAIAQYIGYDMQDEPQAGRPRKYASREERKRVQRERNKLKRRLANELLKADSDAERAKVIEALKADLEALDTSNDDV